MKRPIFLTIWLVVMLLLAVSLAIDSLTYLPMIRLTKNYISLIGIIAGFVQIWAIIQLLRWKRIGVTLLLSSAIAIMLVTAANEFMIVSNVGQIIVNMLMVLVVNMVIFGILYLAINPVWKNFK